MYEPYKASCGHPDAAPRSHSTLGFESAPAVGDPAASRAFAGVSVTVALVAASAAAVALLVRRLRRGGLKEHPEVRVLRVPDLRVLRPGPKYQLVEDEAGAEDEERPGRRVSPSRNGEDA